MQSLCSLSFSSSLNQAFQIWLEISLRWTYTNETFDEILCGPSRSEFSYARLSLRHPKRSQENVEPHISRQDHLGQLQTYGHQRDELNCNLSVLAESTESISGRCYPCRYARYEIFLQLLLWHFFLQMSHACGRSLSDLSVYLYPFAVVYFDSFIPALMLTEYKLHQPVPKMR